METKGFFQFEIIIHVLVSSLWFTWIPVLWVCGHYKFVFFSVRGQSLDWHPKAVPTLKWSNGIMPVWLKVHCSLIHTIITTAKLTFTRRVQSMVLFNPLTAGAAYIRVFIFYQHIKHHLLNMLKIKCDTNQQYLKTVDLQFVKSE